MKNILIIDDDKLNLATARRVLSGEYKVIPAMKGTQALSYLQNGDCDIILLDINMPEMDGYDAVRAIRNSAKGDAHSVPVFAITANAFAEDIAAAMDAGMNGHIAKPIEMHILYETIEECLKDHEQV